MTSRRWISVAATAALAVTATVLAPSAGSAPAREHAGRTVSAYCKHGATRAFRPTSIRIAGITRGAKVLALPRHGAARVRSAPATKRGAREFAWDAPRPRPGARHGNVLLNAHTWPWSDPIALGNDMLLRLRPGDTVVVRGKRSGERVHLCYRVTRQHEIRANQRYDAYYARHGRPKLAIMVCSGTRRGPGDWANRMIWFAAPYGVPRHRSKPPHADHPKPSQAPEPSSGLGGLLGALLGG